MYLDILNDNMVGYANISARGMLDHLFETYGNITAVDLEINFETCAGPGIPNSQWRLSSSRFKIVLTIQKLVESSLVTRNTSTLDTQKYFQQATSWAPVPGGTRNQPLKKLGHNSNPISQPHTVNTSKCKENPLPQPVTTLQMPLWLKMKIRWPKPPLDH
jgi:hypothetical protein